MCSSAQSIQKPVITSVKRRSTLNSKGSRYPRSYADVLRFRDGDREKNFVSPVYRFNQNQLSGKPNSKDFKLMNSDSFDAGIILSNTSIVIFRKWLSLLQPFFVIINEILSIFISKCLNLVSHG